MLSVANLESQKVNKDQVQELLKYIADKENEEGKGSKPSKTKSQTRRSRGTGGVKLTPSKAGKSASSKILSSHEETNDDEEACRGVRNLCCCLRKKTQSKVADKETLKLWRNKYCRDFEEFITVMGATTKNARLSIPGFSEIKREISYTDDPAALAQGLSTLGGIMWLLTYGVQHLVDPTKTSTFLPKVLLEIRGMYESIGETAQRFVIIAENFNNSVTGIHETISDVVKKLSKKFKFTKDPLKLRPIFIPKRIRVKRRIGYQPENEDDGKNPEVDDEEGMFHANWSPLTIVVQYPDGEDWEIYAALAIEDKIKIFKLYIKYIQDKLDAWITKFNNSVDFVTKPVVSEPPRTSTADSKRKNSRKDSKSSKKSAIDDTITKMSMLNELSLAMQDFMKNYVKPKIEPGANELETIQTTVEDFWFHMDNLYELSYELTRFITETRDIIKTCYVYATHFYQWKLVNFETFDPKATTKEFKNKQKQMKTFLAKFLGQRRFSDAAMFISLADFTSSIYQHVAEQHQFETNGYAIKLESLEDEEAETWGLVGEFTGNLSGAKQARDSTGPIK